VCDRSPYYRCWGRAKSSGFLSAMWRCCLPRSAGAAVAGAPLKCRLPPTPPPSACAKTPKGPSGCRRPPAWRQRSCGHRHRSFAGVALGIWRTSHFVVQRPRSPRCGPHFFPVAAGVGPPQQRQQHQEHHHQHHHDRGSAVRAAAPAPRSLPGFRGALVLGASPRPAPPPRSGASPPPYVPVAPGFARPTSAPAAAGAAARARCCRCLGRGCRSDGGRAATPRRVRG